MMPLDHRLYLLMRAGRVTRIAVGAVVNIVRNTPVIGIRSSLLMLVAVDARKHRVVVWIGMTLAA